MKICVIGTGTMAKGIVKAFAAKMPVVMKSRTQATFSNSLYIMKKQVYLIVVAILFFALFEGTAQAQTATTRTFTFTGRDAVSNYVRLNRVVVTNHTSGWEETLVWPDTVLTLEKETGVEESVAYGGFNLAQNNPNPFTGTTDVNLTVADAGTLTLEIMDVNGRIVVETMHAPSLPTGIHQFRITLSAAGTYVMTARQNGKSSSIKMVNNGGGNRDGIEYMGIVETMCTSSLQPKFHTRGTVIRPFNIGDQMEYVGYATVNGNEEESQHITQSLWASRTFVLQFPTIQFYLPAVITSSVTNITGTSASCGGNVTFDGHDSVTARGICWSTSPAPTIVDSHTTDGSGTGTFTSILTGLTIGNTYFVRAYATNSVGTAYGNEVVFSSIILPTVVTLEASDVAAITATCGGEVIFDGGNSVTTRGVCWSDTPNPTVSDSHTTNGSGIGSFVSGLTGLYAGNTFYVRAYATNNVGTAYGNEVSFVTENYIPEGDAQPCPGVPTVTDIDGNVYNTVKIGEQCWMKENLRVTRYADSTFIPVSLASSERLPYRVAPNNDEANVPIYGYLYNWPAVMHGFSSTSSANPSGVQGVCPAGWHVPSDAEWTQLRSYVSAQTQSTFICHGNSSYNARALADTIGWLYHDQTACDVGYEQNNATGFSARPAGTHNVYDQWLLGAYADFWSSTQSNGTFTYIVIIAFQYPFADRTTSNKDRSQSVRCVLGEGAIPPSVVTTNVTDITDHSATCNGNVTATGGATVTSRGICWSTSHNPIVSDSHTTNGSGIGGFAGNMTMLLPNTTYYARAYAISVGGTAYGDEVSFTTAVDTSLDGQPCADAATVTDRDGNVYNTVQIGAQCWLKENLRSTQYADGTPIAEGNWYYPNNDSSSVSTYGLLYNWPAAMHGASSSIGNPSGVQGVCPTGWHLPSNAEWTQLTNYVGSRGLYICGNNSAFIAKALASTSGWHSSIYSFDVGCNQSTNNVTAFSAFPAGYASESACCFGDETFFWSSTGTSSTAYTRYIYYYSPEVHTNEKVHSSSCSVRCIRD